MKRYNSLLALLFSFLILSCGSSQDDTLPAGGSSQEWLIPSNEVMDGGPGKDGIPSIDNPNFTALDEVDFLADDDLVVGVQTGGAARAYPHSILDWHEIVNDDFGAWSYALTYCPLTGTAISWNRNLAGGNTTFGVSGKLYNNNLLPYDRSTDSYWSQLTMSCVNGNLAGTEITTLPIIETTWKTWKKLYPNSQVLNQETGFSRDYDRYPYGDYKTNNTRLIFPLSVNDSRLPSKDRVLGVVESFGNKAYPLDTFEEDSVIFDTIGEQDVIVIGSKEYNLILCFKNDLGLENFEVNFDDLPNLGQDADGNVLDISGQLKFGPLAGEKLEGVNAFMGYWFAFGAFYPGIEL